MTMLPVLALTLTALAAVSASQGYYGCEGDCVETYKKCAGNGVDGVLGCCDDSDQCVMKSVFYSQCRPTSKPIPGDWDGDILSCEHEKMPETLTACVGDCVGTFEKCAGKNFDGLKSCCNEEDQCVMKNSFYSQCRPASRPVPDGWAGVVVDCTTCGPSSADIGEFIDDDCSVSFIGGFTLDGCDTACAAAGFPACDRPAEAMPDEEASCYGYIEVSPGSCSMRSMDDEFWLSWLTCRVDGVPVPAGGSGGYGDDGGDAGGGSAAPEMAEDPEEEDSGDEEVFAVADVASAPEVAAESGAEMPPSTGRVGADAP